MSYLPSIARFRGITTGRIITLEATGGNEVFESYINDVLYRTHVFTVSGKLTITRFSNVQEYNTLECFIVAGGAGGGNGENYINSNNGAGVGGGGGGGGGGIVLANAVLPPTPPLFQLRLGPVETLLVLAVIPG